MCPCIIIQRKQKMLCSKFCPYLSLAILYSIGYFRLSITSKILNLFIILLILPHLFSLVVFWTLLMHLLEVSTIIGDKKTSLNVKVGNSKGPSLYKYLFKRVTKIIRFIFMRTQNIQRSTATKRQLNHEKIIKHSKAPWFFNLPLCIPQLMAVIIWRTAAYTIMWVPYSRRNIMYLVLKTFWPVRNTAKS